MEDILIKKEESSIKLKDKKSINDFLSSLEDNSLEKNIALTDIIFELTLKNDNGTDNREENNTSF